MKKIIYKFLGLLFSLIGGLVLTLLVVDFLPLDGPQILGVGGCGSPAGLPFAFRTSLKYLPKGYLCLIPESWLDPLALVLDIIFWAIVIYFVWHLIQKYILKKSNQVYGKK